MPIRFQVKFTRTAEKDLGDIWDFISKDSPREAEKFVLRIEHQVGTLERYPERCPLIPENEALGTGYRHLLYGDYRTIFKVSGRTIHVLRILHGSKLLDDSLLG